jgi:hypothetical protein
LEGSMNLTDLHLQLQHARDRVKQLEDIISSETPRLSIENTQAVSRRRDR